MQVNVPGVQEAVDQQINPENQNSIPEHEIKGPDTTTRARIALTPFQIPEIFRLSTHAGFSSLASIRGTLPKTSPHSWGSWKV